MARCRDCFHYELCMDILKSLRCTIENDDIDVDKKCEQFIPSIDIVKVVRCKYCEYKMNWNDVDLCFKPGSPEAAIRIKEDGFCSDGKRAII